MSAEIWVVPFLGQGHLFPCIELCKHLASRNFKATLVISSHLTSSIPSSLRDYPLVQIAEIQSSPMPPPASPSEPEPGSDPFQAMHMHHTQQLQELEKLFSTGPDNPNPPRPVCAIIDVMASWYYDVFEKFQVPTVTFFTCGACSTALEYAIWKAHPEDIKPGETRLLPGLPEDMALAYSDLKRRADDIPPPRGAGPPRHFRAGSPPPPRGNGAGAGKMGPHNHFGQPRWLEDASKTKAFIINTCDDLERPFIDYIANQIGKPVWGVGPLLPEHCWKPAGSLIHDRIVRSNQRANVSEDEVLQWLDTKPRGSVLYVSFGSLVGPTMEEYSELARALESSERPFIWVIQPRSGKPGPPRPLFRKQSNSEGSEVEEEEEGYYPQGLDSRVGKRGLIIRGWAPQLLILSHPSTGGFLSHCGWNSTVEAIGRGVPLLAWPIKGDQYYDAKLVVGYLKVGHAISDDLSRTMNKDDIVKGIERLMSDKEMKRRTESVSAKFQHGFPATSAAALDAFQRYINNGLS